MKKIINIEIYKSVINKLDNTFDNHQFIEKLIVLYEKEYVELLFNHINSSGGIFQTTHAQIGKFLSDNASELAISKDNKINSENIKKYNSKNQNWKKI